MPSYSRTHTGEAQIGETTEQLLDALAVAVSPVNFTGKKIYFSGIFKLPPIDRVRLVKALGAYETDKFDRRVDYLILGHNYGVAKLPKAERWNITVVHEGAFMLIPNVRTELVALNRAFLYE